MSQGLEEALPLTLHSNPVGSGSCPHLQTRKQAQRGEASCPRTYSKGVGAPGSKAHLSRVCPAAHKGSLRKGRVWGG